MKNQRAHSPYTGEQRSVSSLPIGWKWGKAPISDRLNAQILASTPDLNPKTENVLAGWRIGDAGATVFGPKSEHAAPVTIAQLMPPTLRVSAAQRKQIAALIIAAPALLQALKLAIDHMELAEGYFLVSGLSLSAKEMQMYIAQARLAIQSATL